MRRYSSTSGPDVFVGGLRLWQDVSLCTVFLLSTVAAELMELRNLTRDRSSMQQIRLYNIFSSF